MPASPCKLRLHLVYHYVLNTAKVWIVFDVCKDFGQKLICLQFFLAASIDN